MEEDKNVVEENKEVEEGEKSVINPKNNKGIIIIIIGILLILVAVGLFFASGMLNSDKDDNIENNNVKNTENNENIDNSENTENQNDNTENTVNTPVDYTITKEEAEEFINKYGDYLYVLNNDEYDEKMIFYYAISYLAQHQMYTKTDDVLTFQESDIKDLVRILYMRDTVTYGSEGFAANYDADNQTVSMSINIDLLNEDPGPESTITSSIKDFKFEDGIAELTYNVVEKYSDVVHGENGQVINETVIDYQVKLYKVDNELRIKDISNNRYYN